MYLFTLLLTPCFFTGVFFAKKKYAWFSHIRKRVVELSCCFVAMATYLVQLIVTAVMGEVWRNLLTDMCPHSLFFLAICLIFRKYRYAKAIAPWAFMGALITMLTEMTDWDNGISDHREGLLNAVSYIRHAALLYISIGIMLTYGKYEKRDYINIFIYELFFIIWVLLFAGIPYWITGDAKWGALSTGLLKPSIEGYVAAPDRISHLPTTIGDYDIFKELGMPIGAAQTIFYILVSVLAPLSAFGFSFANKKWSQSRMTNKQKNK